MTYQLGVDLGTTYTAAAVARDGVIEMASLSSRATSIPSVLFLKEDGTLLVGDPASRRGLSEPDRVVREFKRRFGDPTPILLGGAPISADTCMAKLLRWVVDSVAEREGAQPSAVAVSHPANWGPYKLDLLGQALRQAGLPDAVIITEPEAAAMAYAATERVEPGETIAVYDLGGGTFDAAVLRKSPDGFHVLGRPEGLERLGGIDFDEAVFGHVAGTVGDALGAMDPDDPGDRAAVARLREECVEAKETLSADTDVTIPVLLTYRSEVRLTRAEFEDMIRPALEPTLDALQRTIASADLQPSDVKTVVLVGGSSRIPLVGQLLASALGRPVSIDVHPKHAVATGAAIAASSQSATVVPAPPPPPEEPPSAPEPVAPRPPPAPEPTAEPVREPPPQAAPGARRRRWRVAVPVAVVAIVIGAVVWRPWAGEQTPKPLTRAQAEIALARVLEAENAHFREKGEYADERDLGRVSGVPLIGAGGVYVPKHAGLVTVWKDADDVVYLSALGDGDCIYVKTQSAKEVETAEVTDGSAERVRNLEADRSINCPTSYKQVTFNGQAWALPSA